MASASENGSPSPEQVAVNGHRSIAVSRRDKDCARGSFLGFYSVMLFRFADGSSIMLLPFFIGGRFWSPKKNPHRPIKLLFGLLSFSVLCFAHG
jgi:hypothetical protein